MSCEYDGPPDCPPNHARFHWGIVPKPPDGIGAQSYEWISLFVDVNELIESVQESDAKLEV